jgi:hypothetical protein
METVAYAGWKNCIRLARGDLELISTTDVGPRIIRLSTRGGENIFHEIPDDIGKTGGDAWRPYGGHRLWHAPENVPRTYSPDNEAVAHEWDGKTLRLSPKPEAATGIAKQIEVTMGDSCGTVTVCHRLVNTGPWDIEAAPWSLTVMAPGGRAILPQEPFVPWPDALLPARPLAIWPYTDMSDSRFTWGARFIQVRQDPGAKTPQKIGIRNSPGWGAYERNGVVFVKKVTLSRNSCYPDFGSNWEVYTNPSMLEMETLGPLARIPANGGFVEHVEQWRLCRATLPASESELHAALEPLLNF